MDKEQFQNAELENKIIDIDEEDDDLDDFESQADNMIFAMRTQSEFFGYPKLMEMSRDFNKIDNPEKREEYISKINLKVDKNLEEALGKPSGEVLEMVFDWLGSINQDFLVNCAKNITDAQTTMLFEGMVYMGLAMDEDEIEES